MKLSFSFSKKQIIETVIFTVIVLVLLTGMAASGADFR
jgi:hypothetical protein